MRYWKCVRSNRENKFTVGKIYRTFEDGDGLIADNRESGWINPSRMSKVAEFIEIKEEGENKMEDLRELLKVGYIVKFEDNKLSKIEINSYADLSFSGEHWFPLERLKSDLTYSDMKIIEVYGRCSSNADAWKLSTDNRELIWKRTELSPTQLKLEELEKKQREIADEMEKLRKEL